MIKVRLILFPEITLYLLLFFDEFNPILIGLLVERSMVGVGKKYPLYITASGNMLTSGNISLKLFMAPLETVELLTF